MTSRSQKFKKHALNTEALEQKAAIFWHPFVHKRFGEELFVFLVSLRPYDQRRFSTEADVVAQSFGVTGYCRYQVFGEHDAIIRIWLPAGSGQEYLHRARQGFTGLTRISVFHVASIRDNSRFPNIAEHELSLAYSLSEAAIIDVQNGSHTSPDGLNHDLICRPELLSSCKSAIKAFVVVSNFLGAVTTERQDAIYNDIVTVVEDPLYRFPALYVGWGFAWLIAEVVVSNYYHVDQLISTLNTLLAPYSSSTHTLLVSNDRYLEADCIGMEAIRKRRFRDPRVHLFLPDLYTVVATPTELQHGIERFVVDEIFSSALPEESLVTLQTFLLAVIHNDTVAAYTALFPAIMKAEQELRDLLRRESNAEPEGLRGVLAAIDPDGRATKSPETISLATILKGIREILRRRSQDTNIDLSVLDYPHIEQLAHLRNKVMHGVGRDLYAEWPIFGRSILLLVRIRHFIAQYVDPDTGVKCH